MWIGGGEFDHLLTAPNLELTGWKPRKELWLWEKAPMFSFFVLLEKL